jgi:hypothetical protein
VAPAAPGLGSASTTSRCCPTLGRGVIAGPGAGVAEGAEAAGAEAAGAGAAGAEVVPGGVVPGQDVVTAPGVAG